MIEILLGVIAITGLIHLYISIRSLELGRETIAHLKGIDAKTITAVADVGSSWGRSDLEEWEIEQAKLREQSKQTFS